MAKVLKIILAILQQFVHDFKYFWIILLDAILPWVICSKMCFHIASNELKTLVVKLLSYYFTFFFGLEPLVLPKTKIIQISECEKSYSILEKHSIYH